MEGEGKCSEEIHNVVALINKSMLLQINYWIDWDRTARLLWICIIVDVSENSDNVLCVREEWGL